MKGIIITGLILLMICGSIYFCWLMYVAAEAHHAAQQLKQQRIEQARALTELQKQRAQNEQLRQL